MFPLLSSIIDGGVSIKREPRRGEGKHLLTFRDVGMNRLLLITLAGHWQKHVQKTIAIENHVSISDTEFDASAPRFMLGCAVVVQITRLGVSN